MKYFKDAEGQLYVDPIEANHEGLVEVSETEFHELLARRKTPSDSQLEEQLRIRRDGLLVEADAMVNRCQDAGDSQGEIDCRQYRQELRDAPQKSGWPHNFEWPPIPAAGNNPNTQTPESNYA